VEREEAQWLTSAEASSVPRAAQQAVCWAGSQELLIGQAAVRPPWGKHPLISLAARGPASWVPVCLLWKGPQRSWIPAPLDRWAQWSPERHGPWSRSHREPLDKSGSESGPQFYLPGILHSSCFLSLSGEPVGGAAPHISLLWGVLFLPRLSEFKGPGIVGDLDSDKLGRGTLNHKEYFILWDFKWTESSFLTFFPLMWPLAKIMTGDGRKLKVSELLLHAGSVPGESFLDTTIFHGRYWFPHFTDKGMEVRRGEATCSRSHS
jgi:hypothetical protein